MKAITLTTTNIDKAIKSLKEMIVSSTIAPTYFYLSNSERKLSSRYIGKGRPKKSDYDYVEIDWCRIYRGINLYEKEI